MKVFFVASLRGKQYYFSYYQKIYDIIKKAGYTHVDSDIIHDDYKEFYNRIEREGRKAFQKLYEKKINNIKSADICVFEVSLHSHSIGFEILKSLEYLKPTIALYLKDSIPHFLAGINDDKFILKEYTDNTIEMVVEKSLEEAVSIRDKRFNFFISPDLLNYLDNQSAKKGITKSAYLRNLIINDIEKNKLKENP